MEHEGQKQPNPTRKGFLLARVFLVLWIVVALVNALLPSKEISVRERRALAGFPEFTLQRVLDGRFEEEFEAYAKDQVLGRDALVTLNAAGSRALGNVYASGVWIGKDGWLIEDPVRLSPENEPPALAAVRRLASGWGFEVALAVIPEAAEILYDRLPWAADGAALAGTCRTSWAALLDAHPLPGVTVCDTAPALSAAVSRTQVYYRTDHHWTTAGALAALPVILEGLGKEAGTFELLKVCDSFRGTLASASGVYGTADEIDVPVPVGRPDEPVLVQVDGENGLRTSVYRLDALSSDDPYLVFMGGNYGKCTITTGETGKGRLLVFKDSYFNCLLPMLLEQYSEIVLIDPRYFDDDPELLLLSMQDAQVLVCYSRAGFLTDLRLNRIIPERAAGLQPDR